MIVFIKINVILRQYNNATMKCVNTNSIKVNYGFFGAKKKMHLNSIQ